MIYKLIDDTDPILRTEAEAFDFENPPIPPNELAKNMVETLYSTTGVGLACNQVGLPYRMFVMAGNPPVVCFNPRVVDQSIEEHEMEEGCLTFPGLSCKIFRPAHIKVRFQDFTGEIVNAKYTGITARIFQHELDHLNGILFYDNLKYVHRERALRKWKQLRRKLKKAKNVQA